MQMKETITLKKEITTARTLQMMLHLCVSQKVPRVAPTGSDRSSMKKRIRFEVLGVAIKEAAAHVAMVILEAHPLV